MIVFSGQQVLAAIFYVNSNAAVNDATPGDGTCETAPGNSVCTLRAAIQEANTASLTTILFTDQFTITDCNLPALTVGKTTINAYDQWDTANKKPGVTLQSPLACGTYHDILTINSSDNHLYGLSFYSNIIGVSGVRITGGSNNTIGTDIDKRRNVFVVPGYGVEIEVSSTGNTISSNYFGTVDGDNSTGLYGTNGIRNISSGNTLSNNVIVAQNGAGIHLSGSNNIVTNNIIGLDKYKIAPLPNHSGIYLEYANDNDINNNTIAGNNYYGILLAPTSNNNDINTNTIGSAAYNTFQGNGSHGVYITSAGSNTIRSNRIAANGESGIYGSGTLGIRGNTITYNQLHGIHLSPTATGTIGGGSYLNMTIANQITQNSQHGIYLEGSSGVTISGNYIGQNIGGGPMGNHQCGIMLDDGASGNIIGGGNQTDANWVASNDQEGISLKGGSTTNNSVKNNVLGASTGFYGPLANKGNGISLWFGTHDNTIGGAGVGNTILASGSNGIYIGFSSDNNSVLENMIGTDGTHNWGNTNNGISLWDSAGTFISKNEIAFNNGASSTNYGGILIQGAGSISNTIRENSIHDNGGLGINLLSGANGSIAPPLLSRHGNTVTGTTCSSCTVELFSDAQDEGRYFEGSVVADTAGDFSWSGNFQGSFITATATDPALNTSMFSTAIPAPFPWSMFL
ncbi:MAG: right-handed parallel beta-helix repeat-containing protein, partial [Proteobacteria bacterium]|nr:right-handed parallel beta-helix repeat-containing protein [Pseudomonadota bacterium]